VSTRDELGKIADVAKRKAGEALSSVRAGDEKLLSAYLVPDSLPRITLSSPWFEDGAPLPLACTTDGEGVPPALRWGDPPESTRSFVIVCEDPDAPAPEPFVHWLVYDIPRAARSLDPGEAGQVREGKNSKLEIGFTPAAPPRGHGVHHYHFQLFALDAPLGLAPGEGRRKLRDAMKGHVLAHGEIVGHHERT
jgi:Raf kinase inhibitor-like YbhB/YbcL family protein